MLSVNSCTGTSLASIIPMPSAKVMEISKRSLKAITSPDLADLVTRRALYDLKYIGATAPEPTPKKQICPSCEDRSRLLSNEESEYPMIRRVSMPKVGIFRETRFRIAYRTARLSCSTTFRRSASNISSVICANWRSRTDSRGLCWITSQLHPHRAESRKEQSDGTSSNLLRYSCRSWAMVLSVWRLR